MDLVQELFRQHTWATLRLIDYCTGLPADRLNEIVPATERSILQMLTHVVGTEQWYLYELTGEQAPQMIQRGEVLPLGDLRQRFELHLPRWQAMIARLPALNITLPAEGWRPELANAQFAIAVQALHHGVDHRTQICTALSLLNVEPPILDGWAYWAEVHSSDG